MIDFNYNIYGIATEDFYSGTWDAPQPDTVSTGTLLETTTYYYFYEGQSLYSVDRDKLLDDSVYLWHIASGSAAGTNSSYCIGVGDTLDLQVVQNKTEKVPLAMQLTNVTNRDFSRDPRARIAYNYFNYEMINIFDSKLFVDINPTTFCNNVVVHCYRKDNNSVSQQSLSNVATYINADPANRCVTGIELQLYHGYTLPRNTYYTAVPGVSKKGFPAVDILTERFLPVNATGARKDLQYSFMGDESYHADWVDDKLYAPFIMANRGIWYSGNESEGNQYYIGGRTTRSVNELRNGFAQTGWSNERVTGGFIKYSDKIQEFDDVIYKWRFNMYYINGGVFLENGFPLTSIPGADRIAIYTSIEIIDTKGENMGTALQRAVKHECAFLGFYFADTTTATQNAVLGTANNNIYLPEKINGTTTGRYFTGDEIPTVPYATATDTSPFEYHEDAPAPSSDTLSMFPTEVMALPRFGHTYKCSFNAIDCLNRHLKSFDWSAANREALFFGQNPYDFIINITGYPMVYFPAPYRSYENIVLGKLDLNDPQQLPDLDPDDLYAIGNPIMGGHIIYENPFGSLYVPPYYSEQPYNMAFLDYEPYTTMFLLLPYAGMVSIPPAVFMGKTMNIRMSVDLLSGAVVYFIFANSTYYCTANGNCGTEVPVSGLDYSSYEERYQRTNYMGAAELLTGVNSVIGNATGATVSASFNNTGGMVGQLAMGFLNTMKTGLTTAYTLIEMNRMAPSPVSVSNGNAPLGTAALQDAVLVINRPVLPSSKEFSASSFKKTMGKAANEVGRLGDYSGFTIVKNPILDGISCTAEEKALIIEALNQGVIL